MEKLKKVFRNKKNLGLAIGGLILVIILIIGISSIGNKKSSQVNVEKYLEEIGADFYENFYYENSGKNDNERINAVKIYKELGIKISLANLERYILSKNEKEVTEFNNSKIKEKCDTENTKVIIYPKDGFGKKDYDLKLELACGKNK